MGFVEQMISLPLTEGGDTAQEVGRGGLEITVGEFSSAHSDTMC